MDYVVFGIGMGASLVLFGLGGRAVGPSLRYRRSRDNGDVLKGEELVARVAWGRFCGSLGAALTFVGIFLILVTGISIAVRVSDSAGTVIVFVSLVAIVVLMALWTWTYIGRFGLYGIAAARPNHIEYDPPRPYDHLEEDDVLDFLTTRSTPVAATPAAKSTNGSVPTVVQPLQNQPTADKPQPGRNQPPANQPDIETPVDLPHQEDPVLTIPNNQAAINQSDADVLERILREPHSSPSSAASSYFFAEPYVEPDSELATNEEQDQSGQDAELDSDGDSEEEQEMSSTADEAELTRRDQQ